MDLFSPKRVHVLKFALVFIVVRALKGRALSESSSRAERNSVLYLFGSLFGLALITISPLKFGHFDTFLASPDEHLPHLPHQIWRNKQYLSVCTQKDTHNTKPYCEATSCMSPSLSCEYTTKSRCRLSRCPVRARARSVPVRTWPFTFLTEAYFHLSCHLPCGEDTFDVPRKTLGDCERIDPRRRLR